MQARTVVARRQVGKKMGQWTTETDLALRHKLRRYLSRQGSLRSLREQAQEESLGERTGEAVGQWAAEVVLAGPWGAAPLIQVGQ